MSMKARQINRVRCNRMLIHLNDYEKVTLSAMMKAAGFTNREAYVRHIIFAGRNVVLEGIGDNDEQE